VNFDALTISPKQSKTTRYKYVAQKLKTTTISLIDKNPIDTSNQASLMTKSWQY
jgi:phosphoribosylpyrophosphate synthetase